ncbi:MULTISPECIES: DUF465 domain-containing protein [unclassified Pseudomonas]|jgi:uncharacterized protein YdcH (DUF465 family)|uniref:DUF465 domain-containing protein n=1 Tax=unclassified Pseudomonas TaxID=196821 RepID=UPI000DAF0706|nr:MULTISPECIES: DUF465 domain-containing protein [unclassified Pseudomonas]MBD9657565.1 YdcH family protein [Pseudomonas sp. PDM12]PZW41192.1 hypothetical protein F469_04130 [Pseudomonas sp. URMO17WK12:I2]
MHIDYSAQPEMSPLRGNRAYAALVEQHEDVDRRIARIESGLERPEGLSLAALKLRRSGLREDLARQQRKALGQCCNCGNNCAG